MQIAVSQKSQGMQVVLHLTFKRHANLVGLKLLLKAKYMGIDGIPYGHCP